VRALTLGGGAVVAGTALASLPLQGARSVGGGLGNGFGEIGTVLDTPFGKAALLRLVFVALLLGALAAYALQSDRWRALLRRHLRAGYVLLVLLFAGIIALTLYTPANDSFGMNTIGYSWLATFYALLLVLVVLHDNGPIAAALRFPVLRFFGAIAFGLYLIHQTARGIFHALLLDQVPQALSTRDVAVSLLAYGLAIAVASASFFLFERRFIRWGRSFAYRRASGLGS
jgi:peptidoglycan/LPS O-acetylase OafA/YrhL